MTKTVVRPGRRNGGTTIIFALKQRTMVRFTVVRVYPSCERVGSFRVRAHKGMNRVRFRGRLGGRPLSEGTYRLIAQARGQEAAAATATIVIARGKTTSAQLRRARGANVCSTAEAQEIESAIGVDSSKADPPGKIKKASIAEPVVAAAKTVVKKAKGLAAGVAGAVEDSPFSDPFVLLIVGLFTLSIATLGTIVLYQIVKGIGLRDEEGLH